jgi:hypothetical protein
MRYIIESAALHAMLLNRTLVIPSYVYAKSCEGKMSGIVFSAGKWILTSDAGVNSARCMQQWFWETRECPKINGMRSRPTKEGASHVP